MIALKKLSFHDFPMPQETLQIIAFAFYVLFCYVLYVGFDILIQVEACIYWWEFRVLC